MSCSISPDFLNLKGCSTGGYRRLLTWLSIPTGVDADKVEAAFTDGVLKITLPKREEAKIKKIELKAK